ncbi:MAG: hypothetical protein O3A95_09680 [Planctomycetota bacterium]|nr:hypothetical protein [Planctomycetota bacterium]MDA1114551.1 hypothetical protein [Planctomycetota bacterium]
MLQNLLILGALCAPLSAQTVEDFETYPVANGAGTPLGLSLLDHTTIANGFGPNLVMPGCTYSTGGPFLQWNGNGFFGQTSRNLCGAGLDLVMQYDPPVTNVSFDIMVFNTAPDAVTVEVFGPGRVLLSTTTGIAVIDGTGVPFSYQGGPIASVKIWATQQPSSPIVDNHEYGGPNLSITGACPGGKTLTVTGANAGAQLAIAHGNAGNFVIPSGSCAGAVLDISAPTLAGFFNADANGNFSLNFNPPAGLCGRLVQVVDMSSCLVSQVATL